MMDLCELIPHEKMTNTEFQEDGPLNGHEQILPHNFTCKLVAQYKASLQFSDREHLTFKKEIMHASSYSSCLH